MLPKAKLEVHRLEAGLLNKRSCLAAALGITESLTTIGMILVLQCIELLKSDLDVQQNHLC